MKKRMLAVVFGLLVMGTSQISAGGKADNVSAPAYPVKAVEVTCVFAPGSAADNITRKFSDLLSRELGQPFPVVNRTGGGQSIGYTFVKNQPPDGYSMIWTSNGLFTGYYQGNIDFRQDVFCNIARISYEPVSIVVRYDAPWKTITEFFQYIKDNPGKIKIGNSGVGTFTHLVAVAVESKAGAKVVHVPFGSTPAFQSVLGGQIDASIQLPSEVTAQYEAKQVRFLALSSAERISTLPDVCTFKESNIDLEMILWRGIAVRKGTPDAMVRVLENAAKKIVTGNDFLQFCGNMSIIPAFMPQQEFERFLVNDEKNTGDLMKAIGTSVR